METSIANQCSQTCGVTDVTISCHGQSSSTRKREADECDVEINVTLEAQNDEDLCVVRSDVALWCSSSAVDDGVKVVNDEDEEKSCSIRCTCSEFDSKYTLTVIILIHFMSG